MFGWCLLFMLVIIGLGRRVGKKYALKLSELNSRLIQVEELLLEVCSLVEEERGNETPFSSAETEQLLAAEAEEMPRENQPLPPAVDEELPKTDSKQLPQAKTPLPPTGSNGDQVTKKTKGKSSGTAKPQRLPDRNQQIIELHEKGLSVQEIARQIGKGQGEVQLVVDLYSK